MSPGSSSHSSSGSKCARIFSGTSSRRRGSRGAADAPAPAALRLQQEHVVASRRAGRRRRRRSHRDHQVVEPRVGHEAEVLQQRVRARRRAGPRPAPAASSRLSSAAAARRANGPRRSDQPLPRRCTTRRDSTSSRAASANSSARADGGSAPGHGRAHQQRLLLPVPAHELSAASGRPAGASAGADVHARIVRSILRWKSPHPASSASPGRLEDAQGDLIDELNEPVEFLFGGDDLLAKIEEALQATSPASRRRCTSNPSTRSATTTRELVFFETRASVPDEIEAGMQFDGLPPGAATPGHAGAT